jgi:hypothetical protein
MQSALKDDGNTEADWNAAYSDQGVFVPYDHARMDHSVGLNDSSGTLRFEWRVSEQIVWIRYYPKITPTSFDAARKKLVVGSESYTFHNGKSVWVTKKRGRLIWDVLREMGWRIESEF